MTTDRDPTFEGTRTEQVNVQPPSRVESRASGRAHSDAQSSSGFGTILTSCVLALLMGGAGAWAYVDYLGPMLARNRAQKSQPDVQNSESNSTESKVSDSVARLNDLSGKLDELQSRVDRLPKAISAQDLEPLKERLALVDDVSKKVDALGLRVNSLPGKVDQDSRKITTLTADLEGMRNEVASLRHSIHNSASAEKPSDEGEEPRTAILSEPPREIPPPVRLLQAGVDYFQKKNYAKASEIFARLSKARPDDAARLVLRGFVARSRHARLERPDRAAGHPGC